MKSLSSILLKSLLHPVAAISLIQAGSLFAAPPANPGETNAASPPGALTLWYNKPAEFKTYDFGSGKSRSLFATAMPIGNGRIGALIKGGVAKELIPLNEDTLWTGGLNPNGLIKTLGSYQPLGNLIINLPGHEPCAEYLRSLDLRDGIARVNYTSNGVRYRREYFASYPGQVMQARLSADQPGKYTGSLSFTDAHGVISVVEKNRIICAGGLENELRYETQVLVLNEGGTQQVRHDEYGDTIEFTNCDSVTIIATAGTDYAMDYAKFYRGAPPHERLSRAIETAGAHSYEDLKAAHIADYQSLFNRFSIDLGTSTAAQRALPTDQRYHDAARVTDPEFEQLVCQFGRYGIMACSRPGGVAANLMGIWNDLFAPICGGAYIDDIDPTPMNYWTVETTNLAECHQPLLDLIQSQIPAWRVDTQASAALKLASGSLVKRGWTIRLGHNIMGGMGFDWHKPGNAWYSLHFWEKYAFGRDKEYLAKVAYPIIKESCEYWEDTLKALPDGRLVVPQVWSPEHGPTDTDGTSYGQEFVWDLFTNFIEASKVLDIDMDYRDKVSAMRDKLLVPGVGSWGQLLEWMTEQQHWVAPTPHDKDWEKKDGHIDTPQDTHRHTSHLIGVYPGRQISYEQTPELAAAALVSVKARGNGGGIEEWAWAVRGPIYARLYQGDLAYTQIQHTIAHETPNLFARPCLFDAGPGITATFVEMLLQSHQGDIHVLPALPKAWPTGSVKGIRARGGYEVDESWKDGNLASLTIRSIAGNDVKIRYRNKTVTLNLLPGKSVQLDGNLQKKL